MDNEADYNLNQIKRSSKSQVLANTWSVLWNSQIQAYHQDSKEFLDVYDLHTETSYQMTAVLDFIGSVIIIEFLLNHAKFEVLQIVLGIFFFVVFVTTILYIDTTKKDVMQRFSGIAHILWLPVTIIRTFLINYKTVKPKISLINNYQKSLVNSEFQLMPADALKLEDIRFGVLIDKYNNFQEQTDNKTTETRNALNSVAKFSNMAGIDSIILTLNTQLVELIVLRDQIKAQKDQVLKDYGIKKHEINSKIEALTVVSCIRIANTNDIFLASIRENLKELDTYRMAQFDATTELQSSINNLGRALVEAKPILGLRN